MSLKIVQVASLADKESIFSEYNLKDVTWIVSDLRSKLFLQKQIRTKYGYFEDEMVLRARELWQKLLFRTRPDIRVLSTNYFRARLQAKLENTTINPKTLARYIEELIPILSHPSDLEDMQNWFEENPNSLSQWGDWFSIARQTWDELFSEKMIAPSWQAGFLINASGFEANWNRPLVFDLGCELLAIESDLIRRLSLFHDVTVIEPSPDFKADYPIIGIPYKDLREKSFQEVNLATNHQKVPGSFWWLRLTTALAEVKAACHQVRLWLDAGVPLEKIVVLAADIEEYWPALLEHLNIEGVPVKKSEMGSLAAKPQVMQWRSALRAASQSLEMRDYEFALFSHDKNPALKFEDFISSYSVLFTEQDLKRIQSVYEKVDQKIQANSNLTSDEFLSWSLHYYPLHRGTEEELRDLGILIQEVLKDIPEGTSWSLAIWLDYLDRTITGKEFEITPANSQGIECQSIMSAQSGQWSHRIYLGQSEEQLKGGVSSLVKNPEILSIKAKTGHLINHPDRRFIEFQVRWLESLPSVESVFTFAETDFTGKILTPSIFWIRGRISSETSLEQTDSPKATRWDELQEQIHLENFESEKLNTLSSLTITQQVQRDSGLIPQESTGIKISRSLSAGSIERYSTCGFAFAAEKVLNLIDPSIVDIDPDARDRGTILHEILRKVTMDPMDFSLGNPDRKEALYKIIEEVYDENTKYVVDPEFKKVTINYFLRLVSRFIQNEKLLRSRFKEQKILMREEAFKVFIDPSTGLIRKDQKDGDLVLNGKIDRVDGDGHRQLVVVDYKSKNLSFRNADNWIKNLNLQLLIYAMVLEALNGEAKVKGASYYGLQDMSQAGFVLDTINVNLFGLKKVWEEKEYKEALDSVKSLMVLVADGLEKGKFQAIPKDKDDCKYCSWSNICRAPHLDV